MTSPHALSPQWEALAVEASSLCPAAPIAEIREAIQTAIRTDCDPDAFQSVGYGTPTRPAPLVLMFARPDGYVAAMAKTAGRYNRFAD